MNSVSNTIGFMTSKEFCKLKKKKIIGDINLFFTLTLYFNLIVLYLLYNYPFDNLTHVFFKKIFIFLIHLIEFLYQSVP